MNLPAGLGHTRDRGQAHSTGDGTCQSWRASERAQDASAPCRPCARTPCTRRRGTRSPPQQRPPVPPPSERGNPCSWCTGASGTSSAAHHEYSIARMCLPRWRWSPSVPIRHCPIPLPSPWPAPSVCDTARQFKLSVHDTAFCLKQTMECVQADTLGAAAHPLVGVHETAHATK